MGFGAKVLSSWILLAMTGSQVAWAQFPYPNPIRHVVVVFQENRTPDNLFRGLLTWPGLDAANYDIATFGMDSKGDIVPLEPVPLAYRTILTTAIRASSRCMTAGRWTAPIRSDVSFSARH
jgi:phospholipase C